jgi:hypothetical protein
MHCNQRCVRASLILVFCLLNIGFGLYAGALPLLAGGVAGTCYVALMMTSKAGGTA